MKQTLLSFALALAVAAQDGLWSQYALQSRNRNGFQAKYGTQGGQGTSLEFSKPEAYNISTHGEQQGDGSHQASWKYGTPSGQSEYSGIDQAKYRPAGKQDAGFQKFMSQAEREAMNKSSQVNNQQPDAGSFQSKYRQGPKAGFQFYMQQGGNDPGFEKYIPAANRKFFNASGRPAGGQDAGFERFMPQAEQEALNKSLQVRDQQPDDRSFQSRYGQGSKAGNQSYMQKGGNDADYEKYIPADYRKAYNTSMHGDQADGTHHKGSKYGTPREQSGRPAGGQDAGFEGFMPRAEQEAMNKSSHVKDNQPTGVSFQSKYGQGGKASNQSYLQQAHGQKRPAKEPLAVGARHRQPAPDAAGLALAAADLAPAARGPWLLAAAAVPLLTGFACMVARSHRQRDALEETTEGYFLQP